MNNFLSIIRTRKVFFIVGLILIVLIAGRTLLLRKPNTQLTYTVKHENLVDTVQVSGTYKTAMQVPVMSYSTGVISEIYVNNGDDVKKGDPLFHVNSTATEAQQKTAYANYQVALSSLNSAKNTKQGLDATMWTKNQAYLTSQNTQNYKNDHTQNPATKNDYTDLEKLAIDNAVIQAEKDFRAAEQAYKSADIAVSAAQAQVTQTQQAYAETQDVTVTAPASGTVDNLLVRVGDQVIAPSTTTTTSSAASQADPVLVIANSNNQYISSTVSENYAPFIKAGQKISIIFDALKDKEFTGHVESINEYGTTDAQGIVTYSARFIVNNVSFEVKPGMTAIISIETLRKNDVVDVPNSAIVKKDGKFYVVKANTRNNKFVEVTLGTKGITKTEVVSGLTDGTVIVASPTI